MINGSLLYIDRVLLITTLNFKIFSLLWNQLDFHSKTIRSFTQKWFSIFTHKRLEFLFYNNFEFLLKKFIIIFTRKQLEFSLRWITQYFLLNMINIFIQKWFEILLENDFEFYLKNDLNFWSITIFTQKR